MRQQRKPELILILFRFLVNYRKLKYCLTGDGVWTGNMAFNFLYSRHNQYKRKSTNSNTNFVPISTINIKPKGSTNKHDKRKKKGIKQKAGIK